MRESINTKPMNTEEILTSRTKKLAMLVVPEKNITLTHYVRFRLGKTENFGIPYLYVDEVMQSMAITHIPYAPEFIAGVMNWRSEILTVLNLHRFFQITNDFQNELSWVVVIKFGQKRVGIRCEEVLGDDYLDLEELKPPFTTSKIKKLNFIQGIYRGEVTLLNIESILSDDSIKLEND